MVVRSGFVCKLAAFSFALFLTSSAWSFDPRADLLIDQILPKSKCPGNGDCFIQKFTVYITNGGATDAPNTTLECYLSEDQTLDTDPNSPTADTLVRRVNIGKLKTGKTKKKTLGGGAFKKLNITENSTLFFVLDSGNLVDESNEDNNRQIFLQRT